MVRGDKDCIKSSGPLTLSMLSAKNAIKAKGIGISKSIFMLAC